MSVRSVLSGGTNINESPVFDAGTGVGVTAMMAAGPVS
jgi:hypothetical protein